MHRTGLSVRVSTEGATPITTSADPSNNLQTVDRALRVLELFTAREPEWGLTELSARVGISKSMVHRLLSTLVARGFVEQNQRTHRYRLGLRLLGLGAVVGDNLRIRQAAYPHIELLAHEMTETVFLTVPEHDAAMAVARVELRPRIKWLMNIGERSPLTVGASNKILLAYLPEEKQVAIIRHAAQSGAVNAEQLTAEVELIRQQGWAFTVGEVTVGTAAVAVPILGRDGALLGGLAVAGSAARFQPERIPTLVSGAQETALDIARQYQSGEAAG